LLSAAAVRAEIFLPQEITVATLQCFRRHQLVVAVVAVAAELRQAYLAALAAEVAVFPVGQEAQELLDKVLLVVRGIRVFHLHSVEVVAAVHHRLAAAEQQAEQAALGLHLRSREHQSLGVAEALAVLMELPVPEAVERRINPELPTQAAVAAEQTLLLVPRAATAALEL
jgi:hypothetical protein